MVKELKIYNSRTMLYLQLVLGNFVLVSTAITGITHNQPLFIIAGAAGFVVLNLSLVKKFRNREPRLIIDSIGITTGQKTFLWSEIKSTAFAQEEHNDWHYPVLQINFKNGEQHPIDVSDLGYKEKLINDHIALYIGASNVSGSGLDDF